ncbi:hypothetical protein [Streptomyces sp. NPDC037389]|uniref:hypothetical protein n=1 Tax=Streptomyces sp. NPDC037389 TaxID=3155369 RepID=UPI0033D3D9DB
MAISVAPRPPEAVVEALLKGATDSPICRVEPAVLADAIDVVNAYAETAHTTAELAELHDAAAAASIKRWGRARWCCSPDLDPEQIEDEPDIAAEWGWRPTAWYSRSRARYARARSRGAQSRRLHAP